MVRIKLVFWLIVEVILAILSQYMAPPWDQVFMVLTVLLLVYFTIRGVMTEVQGECKISALKADFDKKLVSALETQKQNMVAHLKSRAESHQRFSDDDRLSLGTILRQPVFRRSNDPRRSTAFGFNNAGDGDA